MSSNKPNLRPRKSLKPPQALGDSPAPAADEETVKNQAAASIDESSQSRKRGRDEDPSSDPDTSDSESDSSDSDESSVASVDPETEKVQKELKKVQKELKTSKKQVSLKRTKVKELQADIKIAKYEFAAKESRHKADLLLKEVASEKKGYDNGLKSGKAIMQDRLNAKEDELKSVKSSLSAVEAELTRVRARNTSLEAAKTKLEADKTKLKSSLEQEKQKNTTAAIEAKTAGDLQVLAQRKLMKDQEHQARHQKAQARMLVPGAVSNGIVNWRGRNSSPVPPSSFQQQVFPPQQFPPQQFQQYSPHQFQHTPFQQEEEEEQQQQHFQQQQNAFQQQFSSYGRSNTRGRRISHGDSEEEDDTSSML